MLSNSFALTNQTVMITGGSQGIGLACAQVMGAAGARIIICGRNTREGEKAAQDLKNKGLYCHFTPLDVGNEAQVVKVIDAIVAESGAIDVLVNNAGIAQHSDTLDVDASAMWKDVVETNLLGTFLCSREVIRHMIKSGVHGSIVNIGSISAMIANIPQNQAMYNASKAGVHMLTKSLASEYATSGIRVNCVAPGYIDTAMTRGGFENPNWSKIWLDMTPMGRAGEAEEVANAVLFLASKAASYITGAVLTVDGGYTTR
jgi:NAD(P)-dependent dehydrogenase (short-subunit alcohol dehydrogenase family)